MMTPEKSAINTMNTQQQIKLQYNAVEENNIYIPP